MIASCGLLWLATGLFLLADGQKSLQLLRISPSPLYRIAMRALSIAALAATVWLLCTELGATLGAVGALVAAMAIVPLAIIAAPLKPRLFTASLPAAGVVTAVALVLI